MFVFRKARNPTKTLNDLDAYLNSQSTEPIKWLAREVQSWNEFSYAELEAAILDGRLEDIIDWQARYAAAINTALAPQWSAAIEAASKKASRGKVILSDTNDWVKAWLTAHGAELATKLSDESKKAIANVLLKWQGELLRPREMAYQIRPLIGLNERQAIANANYRAKLYRSMIDNGVNPKVAAERADNAATRYASKQHRYRAETIVNTELAFAYNQGAHEGVTRSIAGNYMNHCEMVWTTAGTNRVCSRCLELKDTVVGRTDESGVTLPPLHPRCRCAIMYRELKEQPKPKPLSVAECKNFDELKSYWAKNYNVAIDERLKNFDFAATKEAASGLEKAMQLIPSTRQYLKELRPANGKGWLYRYVYEDCAVEFNQSMFLPENIAATRELIKQMWQIVKNSTIESMAAHEMGHAANSALTRALGLSAKNINKVSELFVKDVFDSLPKAERAAGLNALRGRISKLQKYAQTKSETLSEAINDVIANGKAATVFSEALTSQIEAAISGGEFLIKHVLSKGYLELRRQFGFACLDDVTVRKWYIYHDKRIPTLLDQTLSLEDKARRAFELRNEYRMQARDLMSNQKLRRELDRDNPNPTWEGILKHKMEDKGMSYEEAIKDIYETSTKSNPAVNRQFGLE